MDNHADIPLLDAIDMEILMHRDAHFGSNFAVMLDYYEKEGVGVMPDYELDRIISLMKSEEEEKCNLSELLLPGPAKEKIEECQEMYRRLRDVFEKENSDPISLRVAELILSEEEFPEEEINALKQTGEKALPALIDLLGSTTFYDPLSPGYGRAPLLAAMALEVMGNEKAIPPLFEAIGKADFFTDEALIAALISFGDKSKEFLIKRLKHRPFSRENDNAAMVLSAFPEDETVAHEALLLLEEAEGQKRPSLAAYLIFLCAALKNPEERERFSKLLEIKELGPELLFEIKSIVNIWNN